METRREGAAPEPGISAALGRRCWLTYGAGLAYLALGLWIASYLGTWTDEEYTLATTAHGIGNALSRARTYELQAPRYVGLLAAGRELSGSVWFARLFSLLCAGAFFFVLVRIGARIAPQRDPLPFAMVAALNPFVVIAALEIRLYALALLISGLLWLAFDAGYLNGSSARARLWFVLLAICGVYVQYFLAFMLIGFGCALLVLGRYRTLAVFVAHASIVALAAVPLGIVAHAQVGGYETAEPPRGALVRLTAVHPFLDFLFPYNEGWSHLGFRRSVYDAMALLCGFAVILARPPISRRLLALFAAAATIQLCYVALTGLLGLELNGRYFVALFVPVAAAAYGLYDAVRRGPRPAFALAFAPVAALAILGSIARYGVPAQSGDWTRVAPYLEQSVGADAVIAIYPPDALPAFERQYRGKSPVVPFPRPASQLQYSVREVSVASTAEARAAFTKVARYPVIWFVDAEDCQADLPHYGCQYLHDVLNADYRTLERRSFFGSTVYELSRPGNTAPQAKGKR